MKISNEQKTALQYYIDFNCPELVGTPEFKMSGHSSETEEVCWIDEVDYTKKEYEKLLAGEAVANSLSSIFEEALKNNPRQWEAFFKKHIEPHTDK